MARMRPTGRSYSLTTAGTSLTAGQTFACLYSAAGALLAQTADQAAAWATTGEKVMPLSSPYNVPTPGLHLVMFWSVFSGTAPVVARAAGTASAQVANIGMSAAPYRSAIADTSLTTTAPATLGAQSTSGSVPLIALS
jgi:hypothetical protein